MAATPELFEISSVRLAELYADLRCDGCGAALAPRPETLWAKAGCGYFCADCLARGLHLTAPCALRPGARSS
ncbi:MAG: hypothetical protein HLUCCA08_08150 [Rhodobacteraceae bacterium HLUCCA08]|nr:MAG: hypothetical protein HLUCCA08_08150 [Rhodobacteraceae bacterium HLUCCA08]